MYKVFLFVLFFSAYVNGISQRIIDDMAWVNLGTGIDNSGSFSLGTSLSYQHKFITVSTRFINISNACNSCTGKNFMRDIGLLFGLIYRKENGFISAGAGVGNMFYREVYNLQFYNHINDGSEYSIPLELQMFITRNNIGFGMYGFADFNSYQTFAGALICLQIKFSSESRR